MATSKFTTLYEWDTVQSADSTEWCPLAPGQSIFVCGTYQIEKEDKVAENTSPPTTRHGRIYVFELADVLQLIPHQVIDLPAVLDMKWSQTYICGKILLGVVTATAKLLLFELIEDKTLIQIAEASVLGNTDTKEVLALSLDWSNARCKDMGSAQTEVHIIVSHSQGGANLFLLSEKQELVMIEKWLGHEYEAWIAAFNYWESSVTLTGGDDCILKGWDVRSGLSSPIFINRSHNAGVTSLHSNALFEHIFVSGSYDESLRFWDLRKMKNPLHTTEMFGGVWRVKWNPFTFDTLLTACMHGGFNVVDFKNPIQSEHQPQIFASYKNHESIAYGADWSHLNEASIKVLFTRNKNIQTANGKNAYIVSTCSFYDHKLCISLFTKADT
ncbi:Diphthine methyltransferase [Frankliniella fusca]|uniref:methylated diphthine methylhydrolase n=1 Tax=Frankliniella fusca TaxID=407009 RepID=A0AAE1LUW0_9NEOP|nr:Diphthine methyltransferase [Frankliniella fusca]